MDCPNCKNEVLGNLAPVEFFEWSVLEDGTLKIDGYKGDEEKVVIPSEIDGKRVTVIGNNSFQFGEITSITIPNSVTAIGVCAFASCTSLTLINIPESVNEIGEMAFMGCSLLTSLNLPDSVTVISGCTFAGCTSLSSISIPAGVTKICDSAFTNCTSLTSITIPDSAQIAAHAFDGTPLEDRYR